MFTLRNIQHPCDLYGNAHWAYAITEASPDPYSTSVDIQYPNLPAGISMYVQTNYCETSKMVHYPWMPYDGYSLLTVENTISDTTLQHIGDWSYRRNYRPLCRNVVIRYINKYGATVYSNGTPINQ